MPVLNTELLFVMPKLVFHSTDPGYVPRSIDAFITSLTGIGLIDQPWRASTAPDETRDSRRFLIGDKFLSLVTFMGCAPAIELAPSSEFPRSTDFCHIEFEPVRDEIEFLHNSHALVSRCPHCRQRHADWQAIPKNLRYVCDKCQTESHLSAYDWRHNAGCGRFFISLHGIYPHEAIPTQQVLDALESVSQEKWQYFYL